VAILSKFADLCLKKQAAISAQTMGPGCEHAQNVWHEVRYRSTVTAQRLATGSGAKSPLHQNRFVDAGISRRLYARAEPEST
jgi:hypothetical protein